MVSWPPPGTRVTVRYRRPAGSIPPLTDAVGHLLGIEPHVRVQTKTGEVVQFAAADVVAVRALSDAPVRTSQIRALEHAAALAWPGAEHQWLDGWLLRAGHGITYRANSAVPLDLSASTVTIPAIVDWYTRRGLTPRLAIADRLLRPPGTGEHPDSVLVRDVATAELDPSIRLSAHPDESWPQRYPRDVLTAVLDGELVFGMHNEQLARASVTNAPDGTRWVGLFTLQSADRALCEALLSWGAARGASRGYLRVRDEDHGAAGLARSLGFALHHRARYFTVSP
jgi:N-acetylglutamate synthase